MTLDDLRKLAATLPPALPEMRPSTFVPRGTWFEFDYAGPLAPVIQMNLDGSVKRETQRVVVVNADEWREAIAADADAREKGEGL